MHMHLFVQPVRTLACSSHGSGRAWRRGVQWAGVAGPLRGSGAVSVREVADLGEARIAARTPGARDLAVIGCDPADPEFGALLAELDGQGWCRVVVVMPRAGTRQIVSALLAGATGVLTTGGDSLVEADPADAGLPGAAPQWDDTAEPADAGR